MKMRRGSWGTARRKDTGPRSPKSILIAQYSLLVSIGTGIAGVTYFTISCPKDTVNIAGNAVNAATLILSTAYLIVHQITSWKYCQGGTYMTPYCINRLRTTCLRTCAFVIIAWIMNSILGLMAAAKSPFCEAGASATLEWDSITGCKIQRASVAGSIMAVVNACLLFYGIKNSRTPFSASLLGIHKSSQIEDDWDLSHEFSFTTYEQVRPKKPVSVPSCDPVFYSSTTAPKLPLRHRSWLPPLRVLPPLKFLPPSESDHPALQPISERPSVSRTPTSLLPTSVNQGAIPYRQRSRTCSDFSKDPGCTYATAASSIYSRSTSISELSRKPSTMSSYSSCSSDLPLRTYSLTPKIRPPKPDVPAIQARYRHPSHSLHNGGQPVRPGSRPALPPAGSWMYANNEQQKQNDMLDGRRQSVRLVAGSVRPRADSNISPTDVQRPLESKLASPKKAVLRPNMNKGNAMRVGKTSYESVRKESISHVGFDFDLEPGDTSPSKTRDSRTLVKQRQPWDEEPRRGRRGS